MNGWERQTNIGQQHYTFHHTSRATDGQTQQRIITNVVVCGLLTEAQH